MVTAFVDSSADSRYRALPGEGFDGVVRVVTGGGYGTGSLLYDGRAVLTAAHVLGQRTQAVVHFETAMGVISLSSSRVFIHPDYDQVNSNNDLAVIWLEQQAPVDAERYELFRDVNEQGRVIDIVGYGSPGSGVGGADEDDNSLFRLKAKNTFDIGGDELKQVMGQAMGWSPAENLILAADFDDGTVSHDAIGGILGSEYKDLGLAINEGLIASGDSGGPAFVDGLLAGVASYTAALGLNGFTPDIDGLDNSSFGELAFWQRVSGYQQWIDESLRDAYIRAPTSSADVVKSIPEGDSGTVLTYFLVEFNGTRKTANSWVSVDYATRDGTALAGEDYLPVAGTLILYPSENHAAIPVEVIGDNRREQTETLFLDIFNPIGGDFEGGQIKLTAMRNIIDDDVI